MATETQEAPPPDANSTTTATNSTEPTKSIEEKPQESEQKEKPEQKDKSHNNRDRNSRPNNRGRGKKRNNNRSNYESLTESKDEDEILRQVDFYFSDSNLPQDAYLLKLTEGPANKPVPLKTIHSFRRMRHFQPFSAVQAAVRKSELVDLDDKDDITRKVPLDSRYTVNAVENKKIAQDISMPRSIYAKGFGYEYPTLQLDIENYFAPYGPINSVRMRRVDDGSFKGSAFIEFAGDELAEQFLKLGEFPTFVQHGKQQDGKNGEADKPKEYKLKVMSKQAYLDSKPPEERDEVSRSNGRDRQDNKRQRGGRSGRGGRDRDNDGRQSKDTNIDKDDWKKRREFDQRVNDEADGEPAADKNDAADAKDESKKRSREEDDAADAPAKKAKADDDTAAS